MKKIIFLIISLIFIFYNNNICYSISGSQQISGKVELGSPTTTEGYIKVYDYSGSGGVGTTTSNMYITDGAIWVGLKGNTNTGTAYTEVRGGTVTITALNGRIPYTDTNGYLGVILMSPLTPDSTRIKTDNYVGYSLSNTNIIGATTSLTLIPAQTGQKIQIASIIVCNYNTSLGGVVELKWSGGSTIIKLFCDAKQSIGWDSPDLSPAAESLQITTSGGDIYIKVVYRQSANQ